MPHHIRELFLDTISPDFKIVTLGPSERRLQKLSKINLFIGPNNAGKSRFLRELAKLHKLTFIPTVELKPIQEIRDNLAAQLSKLMQAKGIADVNGYKTTAEALSKFTSVNYATDSGTISDKMDFCERALKHLDGAGAYERLSPDAVDLAKTIYDFISVHNPK